MRAGPICVAAVGASLFCVPADTPQAQNTNELRPPSAFTGITDPHAWRFTTTHRRPRPDARVIAVDARGRGDFCTVQGAIDAVPAGNTVPRLIKVADGVYTELDWVAPDKPFVTVQGQSRSGTVIQYANNNTLNAANTTDICARQAIPAGIPTYLTKSDEGRPKRLLADDPRLL